PKYGKGWGQSSIEVTVIKRAYPCDKNSEQQAKDIGKQIGRHGIDLSARRIFRLTKNRQFDSAKTMHTEGMIVCAKFRWEQKERSRCACCRSISPIGSRTPCYRRCWRPP